MNFERVSDEIRHFHLPEWLQAHYQHCGDEQQASSHASSGLGCTDYPANLYPEQLLPFAKFFSQQRGNAYTAALFAQNLRFVSDYAYKQLFSDCAEQRRETRFALAKRYDFRAECERFVFSQLEPAFKRLGGAAGSLEELRILVRTGLYFCVYNDARRERNEPMTAVDEFLGFAGE